MATRIRSAEPSSIRRFGNTRQRFVKNSSWIRLPEGHSRKLALANLQDMGRAGQELEALVGHRLAVDLDAPLLDHPQGLRRARADPRRLQDLRDREALRRGVNGLVEQVVGYAAVPEARLELLEGGAGGGPIMESRDDLLREPDLDVARVGAELDRGLPSRDGGERLEGQELDVTPHPLV